jgi:hypothetical protein
MASLICKTVNKKRQTHSGTCSKKAALDITTYKLYNTNRLKCLLILGEHEDRVYSKEKHLIKYEIGYYKKVNGEKPVETYIKRKSPDDQGKIKRKRDRLEAEGPFLGMPHAKKFPGTKIYELRPEGMRIFYYFKEHIAVFLHAVDKKDFKQEDIAFAERRRKELEG